MGDLSLELLGSELKSTEWREPQSGDLEVGYSIDFRGGLTLLGELEGEGHVLPSWTGLNFDHYNIKQHICIHPVAA